jgi:hypothetical protein
MTALNLSLSLGSNWGGVSPLSITAPTAYSYLTSASPYDFGGTITLADTEDAGEPIRLAGTSPQRLLRSPALPD